MAGAAAAAPAMTADTIASLAASRRARRLSRVRPSVEAIGGLALIVGAIALVIFIAVEATLIYSAWHYRASRMPGPAPQIAGNSRLEMVWTALPAVILLVIFVLMTGTMREI